MSLAIAAHLSVDRVDNALLNALSTEAMLALFLNTHPKIANALVYDGKHFTGAWPNWPDQLKKDLADRWATMVAWYGQGMPSPDPPSFTDPIPKVAGDPSQDFGFVMPAERGRHMYLSHVANGLALEMTARVPWSITTYSAKHLADLFSTELWIIYLEPPATTVEGYYFEEGVSPATPAHVMRFFTSNNLIGTDARDTVARLFGWCRILIHWQGTNQADEHAYWGPDVPPIPASMLINGTNFTGGPQPVFGHYTDGCSGTTEFMKSVLRAINIPVELGTPPCGHVMPLFPTIHRALSHGDDPYNVEVRFTAFDGWPVPALEEFLITIDRWNEWFDPSIDPNVSITNVGRRMGELAVQYQSDFLLYWYCHDTAAGVDHASGHVYAALKTFYTLSDLEALHLWEKLAAKAAATDYCVSPSARQPPPPPTIARVRAEPQRRPRPLTS
jgi:hypothetical protein